LPVETKKKIAHPGTAHDHRGWVCPGAHIVTQDVWDHAEVEKIREATPTEQLENLETGSPFLPEGCHIARNRMLPEEDLPGFQSFYEKWWDALVDQELEIFRFLCEILEIPDLDYLGKQQTRELNTSQFGWNHYFATTIASLNAGANRLNTHTDFGQITLLFQDNVGGFENHDEEADIFRPVIPRPEMIIVQCGDMLEKQSNGRWRSALHHVTTPPEMKNPAILKGDEKTIDRYAIGFFVHPDYNTPMEPLPGCETKGKWNSLQWKGEKTAGDWLMKRVALEYERHWSSSTVKTDVR
jgi:isopenicillin N synthase-like dioxygenase